MSANDGLLPISRELYEALRAHLEAAGYEVVTRWRPGLRRIRLGTIAPSTIVLGPPRPPETAR